MKVKKQKPQEIKKRIQVRYEYDYGYDAYTGKEIQKYYPYYISKCPYCGYLCEVPRSYPSMLDDVCVHYDHTEGERQYAVYKATGA